MLTHCNGEVMAQGYLEVTCVANSGSQGVEMLESSRSLAEFPQPETTIERRANKTELKLEEKVTFYILLRHVTEGME